MSSVCFIVGAAGSDVGFIPGDNDFVIAADAGYDTLERLGIRCDLLVGDFDSISRIPSGGSVMRYPPMKDDTDMLLAVKQGFAHGCRTFFIYGGMGGRLDHTIANIQTLAYIADHGGEGYLIGNLENLTVFRNGRLSFHESRSGTISVFAHGGNAVGVTLTGLRYPLDRATLTPSFPLGVSNEFTEQPASVAVENGTLLVLWTGKFLKPRLETEKP
jgi:thiamine pyrophosphokinase